MIRQNYDGSGGAVAGGIGGAVAGGAVGAGNRGSGGRVGGRGGDIHSSGISVGLGGRVETWVENIAQQFFGGGVASRRGWDGLREERVQGEGDGGEEDEDDDDDDSVEVYDIDDDSEDDYDDDHSVEDGDGAIHVPGDLVRHLMESRSHRQAGGGSGGWGGAVHSVRSDMGRALGVSIGSMGREAAVAAGRAGRRGQLGGGRGGGPAGRRGRRRGGGQGHVMAAVAGR